MGDQTEKAVKAEIGEFRGHPLEGKRLTELKDSDEYGRLSERKRLQLDERLGRLKLLCDACRKEVALIVACFRESDVAYFLCGDEVLAHRYYPHDFYRAVRVVRAVVPEDGWLRALKALGKKGYRSLEQGKESRFGRLPFLPELDLCRENRQSALWFERESLRLSIQPEPVMMLSPVSQLKRLEATWSRLSDQTPPAALETAIEVAAEDRRWVERHLRLGARSSQPGLAPPA